MGQYKDIVKKSTGAEFPQDPVQMLEVTRSLPTTLILTSLFMKTLNVTLNEP